MFHSVAGQIAQSQDEWFSFKFVQLPNPTSGFKCRKISRSFSLQKIMILKRFLFLSIDHNRLAVKRLTVFSMLSANGKSKSLQQLCDKATYDG
jgi:hypothetical protein